MGILTAIRNLVLGPRRTDFYGLAKRVRRVPPAELAVAEAALEHGGPIAEHFVAQLREAPTVWRLISPDGTYALRVSTTIDIGVFVPRSGWPSETIRAHDADTGRVLELELFASMAGIVEIHGKADDGQPWPADWTVADEELEAIRARAPWMRLPSAGEIEEQRFRSVATIESWLGAPGLLARKRTPITAQPPADADAIARFEQDEEFALPDAYRELLLLANGFDIGRLVVLGTDDAYRLDIPGPDRLVIVPPDENGATVLAPDGAVRHVQIDDPTSEGRLRARDLRTWVRRQVDRRRRTKRSDGQSRP